MAKCPNCRSELNNSTKCKNCGLVIEQVEVTPEVVTPEVVATTKESKWDVCSIIGFILAIVNIPTCGILGIPALIVSIIGYILSIIYNRKGKVFAEIGIIISFVYTIVTLLLWMMTNFG